MMTPSAWLWDEWKSAGNASSSPRRRKAFSQVDAIVKDCPIRASRTPLPVLRDVAVIVDVSRVGLFPARSTDLDLRYFAALTFSLAMALFLAAPRATAQDDLIDVDALLPIDQVDLSEVGGDSDVRVCSCIGATNSSVSGTGGYVCPIHGSTSADDFTWLDQVRVGYDDGFVIASRRQLDLRSSRYPFRMQINGWGQLRNTSSNVKRPNNDLNQFQLKRARLIFSGHAFNPDISYFLQMDGRSSSGDNVRLLDYFLSFDIGHNQFGFAPGTIGFRTGKFKMPFSLARWMSGKQFEFADRSVASSYFDVNRSLAWGLYGQTDQTRVPIAWETAIFNGFVTGGAETGSSGSLDDNFAYSARLSAFPIGEWGASELADFEWHDRLAMRVGCAFAATTIDRGGSTEFETLRVVDSGRQLSRILPLAVNSYSVTQFAMDTSLKLHGWSTTLEYYFRTISDFQGASVPDLFDHGFWFQLGYFIVPGKVQMLTRWSRVVGDSGTLGVVQQSSDEVASGLAWYFRENHLKAVADITHLNGAPVNSAALDVSPGDNGWLYRMQIQFSF
jgi:hypothetical protein